jgi:type IV secretory pathway VirB9-like protein
MTHRVTRVSYLCLVLALSGAGTTGYAQAQAPAAPGAAPATGMAPWEAPAQTPTPPSTPGTAVSAQPTAAPTIRPGQSLGLTQRAWSNPERAMGAGQSAPGFKRLTWSADRILTINTREGLITTVTVPQGEEITNVIVSDPASIETATAPHRRAFVVKPVYPGIDGNLVVYGSSGNIYTIYLQSTPYNAERLPDVKVMIEGPLGSARSGSDVPRPIGEAPLPASSRSASTGGVQTAASEGRNEGRGVLEGDPSRALTTPRAGRTAPGEDYAVSVRTGAGRLRTDLKILASTPQASIIAPVAAWRDDRFTYLDFGPRAGSMTTWPVASLVVDGVESPVGTRVAGPNRSVLIVEAIGNVVLRNGQHVVCIILDVINNDPRRPRIDETYRDRVPRPTLAAAPNVEAAAAAAPAGTPVDISSGPYPMDRALKLASDMIKGYRGRIREEQIRIATANGEVLSREAILSAPQRGRYLVMVTELSGSQAETVCSDLRHSGRPCRIRR